MTCCRQRLGPSAAIKTWAEFVAATKSEDPFLQGGILGDLPDFIAAMKSPATPPALLEFTALEHQYLMLIEQVFARHHLDGLVYPQMLQELPGLHSGEVILETTVGESNIAGIPGVTVPAGYYASIAPFELIFLGRQWREPTLIQCAHAYEQGTLHRKPAVCGDSRAAKGAPRRGAPSRCEASLQHRHPARVTARHSAVRADAAGRGRLATRRLSGAQGGRSGSSRRCRRGPKGYCRQSV